MLKLMFQVEHAVAGEYRANVLLVAFDSFHFRCEDDWGSLRCVVLIHHLQDRST